MESCHYKYLMILFNKGEINTDFENKAYVSWLYGSYLRRHAGTLWHSIPLTMSSPWFIWSECSATSEKTPSFHLYDMQNRYAVKIELGKKAREEWVLASRLRTTKECAIFLINWWWRNFPHNQLKWEAVLISGPDHGAALTHADISISPNNIFQHC